MLTRLNPASLLLLSAATVFVGESNQVGALLVAPQLEALARDVDSLVNHGAQWFPRLVGLKVRATENARFVVDQALRVSGGSSLSASSELGRLYRDVVAGLFHPSDGESAHSTVANAWLGPIS